MPGDNNDDAKPVEPGTEPTISRPRQTTADSATLVRPDLDSPAASTNDRSGKHPPGSPSEAQGLPQQAPGTRRTIQVGSIINDRFVIDRPLGEGGMGVVYRALDKRKEEARDEDPYVAIKILAEEFKHHPQAFVSLQRETRKSQTLAHPNIITVYDFDRDDDLFYMTMEELDGTTLEAMINDHPQGLEPETAQPIITALAQGLAYAHSKQIVHSDFKPGNIFITSDGTVKILDFGIARAASSISDATSAEAQENSGEMSGLTPAYASNEMFLFEEPHASDDVYALGLVSYELLTGTHPYDRCPAYLALAEGRKAARIKGLKSNQWHAIAAAIELQRTERTADAALFLKHFVGMATTTKALITALAAVVIILGSIAIFRPAPSGPDIAFDSLAPELQTRITQALSDGQEALKFGDYNGALFHFNNAYQLHPKNHDAVDGLDTVIEKVINHKGLGADQDAHQEQLQRINTLLEYPSLAEHQKLLKLKKKLEPALSN